MSATSRCEPQREAPHGWTATQLPDETVRLRRSRFDRTENPVVWSFPTLAMVTVLFTTGPGTASYETHPWLIRLLGVTVVPLSMVAVLAWMLSGVEDWHVRPGSLEIRRKRLGREWTKSYADAELQFRPVHCRGRSAENRPWQLLATQSGRTFVLCESSWRGTAGALDLGHYVSAVTGWPFHSAPGDPVTDGFTRFGQ